MTLIDSHYFLQVCPGALAQQIPYFQQHNPEGLCIATYMNVSTNIGVLTVVIYFFLLKYIYQIPHTVAVPIILIFSPTAAFLAAFVHNVTIYNISIFLFLCCAIGGSAGSLSAVIMNPFLTNYKSDFISASRSGGSFCIVLSAIFAAIQSPGSKNPRFSTKYYMLLIGIILSFSVFAYFYIVKNGIGLRDEMKSNGLIGNDSENDLSSNSNGNSNSQEINVHCTKNILHKNCQIDESCNKLLENDYDNTLCNTENSCDEENKNNVEYNDSHIINNNNIENTDNKNNSTENSIIILIQEDRLKNNDITSYKGTNSSTNSETSTFDRETNIVIKTKIHKCIESILPKKLLDSCPYLIQVLPMCAVVGFVNFNTWGMVTAVSPFAFQNVSVSGEGSNSLGLAYEIGAVCLMLGDFSTTFGFIPVKYAIALFTFFTSMIYISAMNVLSVHSTIGSSLLIVSFAFGKFFEAHLVTSIYIKVASSFNANEREDAARAVGITDQIFTTMGSIMSSLLVANLASCK